MRGWVAPVQLEINGIAHPIEINVAFVEENEIPLLGQSGFWVVPQFGLNASLY